MGLKDVTTARQEKNGTIALKDDKTNCNYLFYRSGYVRREYPGMYAKIYQLNPVKKQVKRSTYGFYESTERVLFPKNYEKLMMLAVNPIHTYRMRQAEEKVRLTFKKLSKEFL